MKIRGADFFACLVSDLKSSAAFYRDVLGLPRTSLGNRPGGAGYSAGRVQWQGGA